MIDRLRVTLRAVGIQRHERVTFWLDDDDITAPAPREALIERALQALKALWRKVVDGRAGEAGGRADGGAEPAAPLARTAPLSGNQARVLQVFRDLYHHQRANLDATGFASTDGQRLQAW